MKNRKTGEWKHRKIENSEDIGTSKNRKVETSRNRKGHKLKILLSTIQIFDSRIRLVKYSYMYTKIRKIEKSEIQKWKN